MWSEQRPLTLPRHLLHSVQLTDPLAMRNNRGTTLKETKHSSRSPEYQTRQILNHGKPHSSRQTGKNSRLTTNKNHANATKGIIPKEVVSGIKLYIPFPVAMSWETVRLPCVSDPRPGILWNCTKRRSSGANHHRIGRFRN